MTPGPRGAVPRPPALRGLLAVLAAVLLAGASAPGRPSEAGAPAAVTFLVAGDTHFGAEGMEAQNLALVGQMNDLPGTPFPVAIGGEVERPRGVLALGDLTDGGEAADWQAFRRVYGTDGHDGQLRYPVFELAGNHDLAGDSPVAPDIARRRGGAQYGWDWGGVRFLCLGLYPDAEGRAWLARELAGLGRQHPLVLFFHYSIDGPYSESWSAEDKQAFARAIAGYNVLAIFHGHWHHPGHYLWQGHDVFRPGSPRHAGHSFLVVRIAGGRLAAAWWDFDRKAWGEAFTRPIDR